MKSELFVINSVARFKEFGRILAEFFREDKYIQVRVYAGKRTLDQNDLFHVFCAQIDRDTGSDIGDTKCAIKLEKGFEILATDPDLREYVELVTDHLDGFEWKWRKIESKKFKCTSLMSVTQLWELLQWMQATYAEQGIILESNKK